MEKLTFWGYNPNINADRILATVVVETMPRVGEEVMLLVDGTAKFFIVDMVIHNYAEEQRRNHGIVGSCIRIEVYVRPKK